MNRIPVRNILIRVKMEPLLSTVFPRPAVPCDAESLKAAVRELDEILLKRINSESVFYFEIVELAVGSVGTDHVFTVPLIELGLETVIIELFIAEVTENSSFIRLLHGEVVVRAQP
jgi:hypothetical protein